MKIIFATGNEGKLREIKAVLGEYFEIVSSKEAGIKGEAEETGKTFEENSKLKALYVMKQTGCPVLADDSGLEIDFLGGKPGVESARFMGHDTSYDIKNSAILDLLSDVPDEKRGARFVCCITAAIPSESGEPEILQATRTMEGLIGRKIAGKNGFGYDPIFFLPAYGVTSAEISPEEKNKISHRGKALRAMKDLLLERFNK
ncbi:MAG: RdgB/HAM1 family non-canonical purine NTP pyrophosphatase [Clostridiales bacterium]|nr:RdgB/HAM1 family non-canonical purine NTP pyrophosphatase [Clostridiales bacterium]